MSQQPEEQPSPWRRWGITLGVLLLIAVAVPLMDYLLRLLLR